MNGLQPLRFLLYSGLEGVGHRGWKYQRANEIPGSGKNRITCGIGPASRRRRRRPRFQLAGRPSETVSPMSRRRCPERTKLDA